MQVCTALQTDKHASTPPLSFLQVGCPSCRRTNSVKALKASKRTNTKIQILSTSYHESSMHMTPINLQGMTSHYSSTVPLLLLHPFISLSSSSSWVSQYQKGKTSLDLNDAKEDGVLGCSGISWTICKQSAPHSRQITTPTPHHSIFTGQMLLRRPTNSVKALKAHSTV